MLIPLPKVQQSTFTKVSFTGLSGIHKCLGGLQMAPTCPARQTASRESPQDWLVRLGIDVATFCDMWSRKQPELMPFGHNFLIGRSCHFVASHYPHPPPLYDCLWYQLPCEINYLKWWAFQLAFY